MLVSMALGAVPDAACGQDAVESVARELERRLEAVQRLRAERRRSVERSMAHAKMPSTMYASTPDRSPPPHPVPLDVKRRSAPGGSAAQFPATRTAARSGHRVPMLASASDALGLEGLARIINRSDVGGEVRIEGFDDAGTRHGPVTLRLGAGEAAHLSATELEQGDVAKVLAGSLGDGEGSWRLEVTSALDIEVLAFIRTQDGFLTGIHDVVPPSEVGHRVVMFNPGSNVAQASRLRIVNPGAESADVRIEGIDDAGRASDGAVVVSVPARAARTLGARELESGGEGITGALGTGSGRWRFVVSSEQAVEVMSLVASSSGHLSNVSTARGPVGTGESGAAIVHRVALLPSAARWTREGVQGFVRVINRSGEAGEVRIEAVDDAGVQSGVVTLAVGAHEAVHFTSGMLELGDADTGLSGGIGAGEGDWRLRLSTTLDVEVLAYVQTRDGALSSLHDVVPSVGGVHRVEVFNPASETSQVSRLRVVNPDLQPAEVRIEAVDDAGESPGGAVELTLESGEARTLTAAQLESGEGEGLSGALGDGEGRWRLSVSADTAIEVMSLLASPGGHLANLSTAPGTAQSPETAAEVFAEHISGPLVQGKCVLCHVAGGAAGFTRLRFEPATNPGHEALNLQVFEDFVAAVDDGAYYILNKVQGVGHGGGVQVAAGTPEFTHLERFLELLGEEEVAAVEITPQTLFDTVRMAPVRKTLRRAALVFAGRVPTDEEYAAAQGGAAALRETIRGLMTGPEFHEFLIRASNDRLLTDRNDEIPIDHPGFVEFTNETYRLRKEAHESNDVRDRIELGEWYREVEHGTRRAPLELIAHVVENDLPYTEILTADYIMANPATARAYGATTRFTDPTDPSEFKPSSIVSYYRRGEGFVEEHDPDVDARRILDPGPLATEYPHAGILNSTVFLRRYPTTATNRNRARSRWTYYHFLGLDIEKSASRTTDPAALADTNNPTMHNEACTVCHRVLDPVAGAFQNYSDDGFYKEQWGGLDSLDRFYKRDDGTILPVRATSWRDRDTLTWKVYPAAGAETLRLIFFHARTDGTLEGRRIYLDRLTVRDAQGGVLTSFEFEDLEVPEAPWGRCGERRRNPATGREDHVDLWGGHLDCAYFFNVDVPSAGAYDVEIATWSNGWYEPSGEDGYATLALALNPYREGDTWYRDLRVPGLAGEPAPNSANSVQWLAERIVADDRFAEAAVEFWWPAIMGGEVAEPPADEEDADFEGLLLAATAQGAEVERLARGFRHGFQGGPEYNLKDLLAEIVLSKWFRADALTGEDPVRRVALRDAGARRLLTPEELALKTSALTGFEWGRGMVLASPWTDISERRANELTGEYRLFYGGIDSDGITSRARDITSVMAAVAKTHATQSSCPIVMRELFLLPDAERRLFSGIDRHLSPILELEAELDIEAGSFDDREPVSVTGPLAAGPANVRLIFTNDYWEPPNSSRNIRLDRLDLRDAEGRVVASHELEELEPAEHCNYPIGDHYALHCNGSVDVPIDVPAAGDYTVEVVAWADQAGDALPRLRIRVESDSEGSAGARAIRSKLVELHDKLLGVQVTPHSSDVEAAYRLFVDVWRRKLQSEARDTNFRRIRCDWHRDALFYDGLANDVLFAAVGDRGQIWLDVDHDRVNTYLNGLDFDDPEFLAETWIAVLAYLLMDYRYLYL